MADELDSGGGECHPAVDRMVSMESGATSDSWDDDYQDYYDEEVSLNLEKSEHKESFYYNLQGKKHIYISFSHLAKKHYQLPDIANSFCGFPFLPPATEADAR